jgi:hypothetical protein
MFRTVPSWSWSNAVHRPVGHIPLLSVQWINSWWLTEEPSETCRVSCQNKIGEISASSWFYYKEIYYDARSHERKIPKLCCLRSREDYSWEQQNVAWRRFVSLPSSNLMFCILGRFFQRAAQESLDVTVNTLNTERHATFLPLCIDYCLWPNTEFRGSVCMWEVKSWNPCSERYFADIFVGFLSLSGRIQW